jgi:hypothetical protein
MTVLIIGAIMVGLALVGTAATALASRRRGPRIVVRVGAFRKLVDRSLGAGVQMSEEAPVPVLDAQSPTKLPGSVLGDGSSEAGGVRQELGEDAGIAAGVGVWTAETWLTTDPHVFDTFSQLSHDQIQGFWDLQKVVDAHHYNLGSEAFQRSLAGHVTEFHVADHLQQAGVHVSMPDASNQPGLDLWADGHPLNVKNYQNISQLHEHFANYPDIPAVVPADARHIPETALQFSPGDHLDASELVGHHQVVVDAALSHADGIDSIQHVTGALEGGGVPDAAFPVVTALISGYREAKLLSHHDTDLGRAAFNFSTDIAGVGIGAHEGAVGGAAVGGLAGWATWRRSRWANRSAPRWDQRQADRRLGQTHPASPCSRRPDSGCQCLRRGGEEGRRGRQASLETCTEE